jgi:hypothetical protein
MVVFAGCIVVGVLLAAGVGGDWMARHVPFFAGYREPQKFAALVVLGYCVFAAVGFAALLRKLEEGIGKERKWLVGVVAGLVLALPFALTPTMLWGANGQLVASDYPKGWYEANEDLNKDREEFKVVFLPWHMYMYTDFAGRVIANPARQFFDKPVIISDDPELAGVALDATRPEARKIDAAVKAAAQGHEGFADSLARQGVKYVILARENDYEKYDWVARQEGLVRVKDYGSLVLYRNTLYK